MSTILISGLVVGGMMMAQDKFPAKKNGKFLWIGFTQQLITGIYFAVPWVVVGAIFDWVTK